ncbi:sarcosine oxidase subunit gamma [Kocuria marina]|uniref:sarcosine oxidase subunit gamma n=1 Tax=Kocuria marina TaxID=223184 RepID=UPI0011AAAD91|nr:sarcosine oxidase subunit gamma family protein [Kocuria indica]
MAEQTMTKRAERTPEHVAQLRRSPVEHLAKEMQRGSVSGARGVSLREVPFLTMIGIRVTPGTPAAEAVTEALGLGLPAECGEVTGDTSEVAVVWLGPDEFLAVTGDEVAPVPGLDTRSEREPGALPTLATHPLAQKLAAVFAEGGPAGQAVDLSANRTTLELSGPSARDVLEKGCHVDLHPRSFTPGRAVSTLLGPVPVVLWQTEEFTYRIMPRASLADYTVRWLLDAMVEYSGEQIA